MSTTQIETIELEAGTIFASDYRTAIHDGTTWEFSEHQAKAIAAMVGSYLASGLRCWSNQAVMERAYPNGWYGRTVPRLFRSTSGGKTRAHPCWGVLLGPGSSKGTVRLLIPKS